MAGLWALLAVPTSPGGLWARGTVMKWGWQEDCGELSVLEVRAGLAPSQHY